jgi:hypothetical protein
MRKILTLLSVLLISYAIVAEGANSCGDAFQSQPVMRVLFDGLREKFSATLRLGSMINTSRIVLKSQKIAGCTNGCEAEIRVERNEYSKFTFVVDGKRVATVSTNDRQNNLLNSRAFSVDEKGRDLILDLDDLSQTNATVLIHTPF